MKKNEQPKLGTTRRLSRVVNVGLPMKGNTMPAGKILRTAPRLVADSALQPMFQLLAPLAAVNAGRSIFGLLLKKLIFDIILHIKIT